MMMQRAYLFDGGEVKAIPLGSSWPWATAEDARQDVTAMVAYQRVSWVRRCIALRAGAIGAMPLEIVDAGGEPMAIPDALQRLPYLLALAEASLCVTGAAYWLRERRGRTLLGLRYLAPQSVTPRLDERQGLVGFDRAVGATKISLQPDDVVWFFEADPALEIGPGTPLIVAALSAATLVDGGQRYAAGFFERGAIPAVLLSVEGNPPQEELRRLEEWWKRLLRGVRRAWETVAVRASVRPQVVGVAPGRDLAMTDLMMQARQQIAVAFGVPQTLLEDAANYATAAEHRLSFYEETIIPRCAFYEAEINRQLLAQLGLQLRFRPDRLEVFQQREAQKAQSLVALVQAGIMSVSEARVQLELDELASDSGNVSDVEREALRSELRRWAQKARRRPDAPFESAIIPPHIRALVEAMVDGGVDGWGFVKQQPPSRDESERRLERIVRGVFGEYAPQALQAVISGGDTEDVLAALDATLRSGITPEITRIAYEEVLRQALEVGIAFDPVVVNAAALDWAQRYAYDLVSGITGTTRDLLRQAIAQYIATPGMTEAQLEALIAPAFGPVRAQMIAVTEVTRAYSQASNLYQRLLAETGFETTRVWRTRHDERVCPICGPLEDRPESDWPDDLRAGPPAHVNCRCWTVLEYRHRGRR